MAQKLKMLTKHVTVNQCCHKAAVADLKEVGIESISEPAQLHTVTGF